MAVAFEPGDDICPPWPWPPWPWPRQKWLDDEVIDLGRQVFASLTLINVAAKLTDAKAGLRLAKQGAELLGKQAGELSRALERAG